MYWSLGLAQRPGLAFVVFPRTRGMKMFPEYRELITRLKGHDAHFTHLFNKHNALDQIIKNKEAHIEPSTQIEIEQRKKEKLALKDEIYQVLRKASA
jgi:uncharacterized protein YdcH (DUF465 family)